MYKDYGQIPGFLAFPSGIQETANPNLTYSLLLHTIHNMNHPNPCFFCYILPVMDLHGRRDELWTWRGVHMGWVLIFLPSLWSSNKCCV